MVCADAQGVWLCVRRLHRGSFVWPRTDEAACTLSAAQLEWLLAGWIGGCCRHGWRMHRGAYEYCLMPSKSRLLLRFFYLLIDVYV